MITIDTLLDEVLLAIFDICATPATKGPFSVTRKEIEAWQSLVHLCCRWRSVVFRSPRRLNLRLFCTPGTPARNMLDVWPALPFVIQDYLGLEQNLDNIAALFEHSDRMCNIDL